MNNNPEFDPQEQMAQKKKKTKKLLGVFDLPLSMSAITTIASLLFLFVCIIIAGALIMGLGGIVVALVLEVLLVLFILFSQKARTNRTTCAKCGTHFAYATDVAYQFVSRSVKSFKFDSNRNGKQARFGEDHKFLVNCTCSQCGEKKQFHKEMRVRTTYYDGSVEEVDINEEFQTYFEKDTLTEVSLKFKLAMIGGGIALVLLILFAINAPSGM